MALEISGSYQAAYTPAATGRNEVLDAARNVQQAKTGEQQAVQRRRDAQDEMQQAEKRLQQARRNEQTAAAQVREAQAEQQKVQQSQTLQTRGSIMSIFV